MTEIETPHELVLVNHFDATPEQVWAAWTDPESFQQWWAAPDWAVSEVVMEVEPRGRFHQVQTAPDNSMSMPFDGFYREVEAPNRLVFTLSDAPTPEQDARTVLAVELSAVDGGTEQRFSQTGVVTDEHFEALRAGTIMFFSRLEEFLAK
ncbi:uncharacterized protein YndB with AHSA1/START domain [Rhodococcus sp. LBL1]|nr:uncharacterized protein YndB with AHSA1/START domain [Rhodococcus sp. LBL1]MDH6684424.1 uncharacterized protein YndB with AHSA1/START domain [Rhodococcus sp. LBL2]